MDRNEYVALVSTFEHAYDKLIKRANAMSPEELHFVPAQAEAWSSNEHLVHLLDADCNLVMRLRGAVAEPGKPIPAWDPEAWKTKNNYALSDGLFCLDLAVALRKFISESLKGLSDEVWEKAWILHPERGELSLVAVLKIYAGHPDFHLKYLERNSEAFAAKGR
ncbi:MAG: DinB family protein [Spirochaetia bacterium]|jgi:hypothetical protein|nr:DinB family protein [Spirochaetia bacterium]